MECSVRIVCGHLLSVIASDQVLDIGASLDSVHWAASDADEALCTELIRPTINWVVCLGEPDFAFLACVHLS